VKIEHKAITVRDLTEDYKDNAEEGVVGYGGRLDIRPAFQREFIYKDKQRDAVIDTLTKGFPLNVMYWAVRESGGYEVIDGQQRTISAAQYVTGDFSFKGRYFHNLQADEKEQILKYELMVYLCEGRDSEKLEWFKIVNIAGERLLDQELRNAVYSGPWLSDAKRYFSKTGCPAYGLGGNYLTGRPIRQEYLETVIEWINAGNVEDYMARHQHDPNANELWLYFQAVIAWVKIAFPKYRREMKGVSWGELYNKFKDVRLDSAALEREVRALMIDDDVTRRKGIYSYVLTREEKHLAIRPFTEAIRRQAYERQEGICPKCGEHFTIGQMEADHITPWSKGGKSNADNCQMLCLKDNRLKGAV
jgi:hypothetical protein